MDPPDAVAPSLQLPDGDGEPMALGDSRIPQERSPWQCCCEREDCVQLRAGRSAIGELEQDVKAAATVGQALLVRHEAYVADAEHDLKSKKDFISKLEADNHELEETNSRIARENLTLNDRIENLNTAMADSELRVKSLTATLQSSQREISRLSLLAARTEQLEARLQEVEAEQASLQASFTTTLEGKRAAERRWRVSQTKVSELLSQIEAIESEAHEERARHEEVVKRMHKSSAVEKELRESESHARGKSEVVSSFVKEILQDNANLQLGMMELRELLSSSNEELESLRSQIVFDEPEPSGLDAQFHDLKTELNAASPGHLSREVHVHHHYHGSPLAQPQTRQRQPVIARQKRKRPVIHGKSSSQSQSAFQSPLNLNATGPSEKVSGSVSESTNVPAHIVAQRRLSAAPSTVPSSPHSTIFDRAYTDDSIEFSRPTSPESSGVWSPTVGPKHFKDGSTDSFFQPMSLPIRLSSGSILHSRQQSALEPISNLDEDFGEPGGIEEINQSTNTDEIESKEPLSRPKGPGSPSTVRMVTPLKAPVSPPKPMLKRTTSHASLLSISGMDIHSTFESPLRADKGFRPPLHTATTGASATVVTAATAQAFKNRYRGTASTGLTQGLRGNLRADPTASRSKKDTYNPLLDTFGRRVGGWISTRWNGTQAAEEPRERSPVKVTAAVDEDALKESLLEDIEGELLAEAAV